MKKLLVIILALFMLASCAGMRKDTLESELEAAAEVGASANSYTENTTPHLTEDYLLGINDYNGESVAWSVNRFDLANLQDLFQVLANGESITNAVDDTFLFSRDDSGIVIVTAADDDANADFTIVAGGTGKLTLGNVTNTDISIVTDGVDISEAELIILDGVTSSTTQLNYLDAADGETGSGSVVFDDTPTLITPNIGAATGASLAVTGIITGLVNTSADVTAVTNFNGTFAISDAAKIAFTLPTAAAGYSICLYQGKGRTDALSVTAASGDYIVLDGAAGTQEAGGAESELHSAGAATDRICLISMNADDWYVSSSAGTWTEVD